MKTVLLLRFNEQREKLTKEETLQEGLAMGERSISGKDRSKQRRWSKS